MVVGLLCISYIILCLLTEVLFLSIDEVNRFDFAQESQIDFLICRVFPIECFPVRGEVKWPKATVGSPSYL